MKKNVLVFPCGSEIGLEIHKSLNISTHFKLFGGSSVDDHGKFVYQNYIGDIPSVEDENFIDKLNKVIKENKIDYLFPAHDSVVLRLAEEIEAGNLACELIASPLKTCEIARSKGKTYEYFENLITTPRTYINSNDLKDSDLPVFLKPDVGQGSKGTYLAKTHEEIEFYLKRDPSLLILENLPGKEYTVDCFTNYKGELVLCEGRIRRRTSNGVSVNSETINNAKFKEIAEKINGKLVFRGVWFFQVKENKSGDLSLLEIAPRVAGTMGLIRCRGANLPLLSLFDAMGYEVSVFMNSSKLIIDRALQNSYQHNIRYKHVYLDFDDTVIINNKVNPYVISFVHQCINNGIKVHLITKHKEDLSATLQKYRIESLFDDIIWIKEEEKTQYINERDSIFVDDSFRERKEVHDALRIPVFDTHMIEGLMEAF